VTHDGGAARAFSLSTAVIPIVVYASIFREVGNRTLSSTFRAAALFVLCSKRFR
jgi:hypothetical protein